VIPIQEISGTVIVFDPPLRQHYDLVSGKPVFHTLFQILRLNWLICWEQESIRPIFHQSVRSGTIGYFLWLQIVCACTRTHTHTEELYWIYSPWCQNCWGNDIVIAKKLEQDRKLQGASHVTIKQQWLVFTLVASQFQIQISWQFLYLTSHFLSMAGICAADVNVLGIDCKTFTNPLFLFRPLIRCS
jgi:hypothetical protein